MQGKMNVFASCVHLLSNIEEEKKTITSTIIITPTSPTYIKVRNLIITYVIFQTNSIQSYTVEIYMYM